MSCIQITTVGHVSRARLESRGRAGPGRAAAGPLELDDGSTIRREGSHGVATVDSYVDVTGVTSAVCARFVRSPRCCPAPVPARGPGWCCAHPVARTYRRVVYGCTAPFCDDFFSFVYCEKCYYLQSSSECELLTLWSSGGPRESCVER